jgi:dihydrofolate synthase/folylpolyglutamate synthase
VDFTERIRVDGTAIREDEAAPILAALQTNGEYEGSFFEVATALALEHFRRRGVDVAVLEVGLGGRLDATNVCFPSVTAITTIDFDHMSSLGNTLAAIAAEKAGIVKPDVPLVLGEMPDEPREVIEAIAARRGSEVLRASEAVSLRLIESTWNGLELAVRLPHHPSSTANVPLPGRHQLANASVAIAAARLFDDAPETWEAMLAGLAGTHWPARLERIEGDGRAPTRVYDVAHNPGGAAALSRALDELGLPEGSVLLFGVLDDKELAAMVSHLARHFRRAITVTPPHPLRARPAKETAEALRAAGVEATPIDDVAKAAAAAIEIARADGGWIVATGSLFTVGPARVAFGDPVDRIASPR